MKLPIYQVNAFATDAFAGNPAAGCPLDEWLDAGVLQRIAAENNLTTAFFVRREAVYELRWFAPATEINGICGHGTLASAFVIFNELGHASEEIRFSIESGDTLRVGRSEDRFLLDFPAWPGAPVAAEKALIEGLGREPEEVLGALDVMAIYADEGEVARLEPDFEMLKGTSHRAVIATAPGDEVDFVSRWFGPKMGDDEDPVTGSSHCTLIPYWAARLGKTRLNARQISARGGDLACELLGDRVRLKAGAVKYIAGHVFL